MERLYQLRNNGVIELHSVYLMKGKPIVRLHSKEDVPCLVELKINDKCYHFIMPSDDRNETDDKTTYWWVMNAIENFNFNFVHTSRIVKVVEDRVSAEQSIASAEAISDNGSSPGQSLYVEGD